MALPNIGFQQDDSLRKKAIERRLKNKQRPAQNVEPPMEAQIKLDQESDVTKQRKRIGY